jgi:DNA-binding Xre family transcriptional regulator
MISSGIMEEPNATMAHFCGGLNCEIQDMLDYKEYADMT